MGCWNKTCGLTGLPIRSGDDVLVFALEQKNDYRDRCYTTAFWRPVLVPFYSTYNDYGGGEQSYGVGFDLLIEGLKKYLVEKDVGENQYHDIAVNRENMDEDLFFNAVHEGRLAISKHFQPNEALVDFVMFRKDVVDDILTHYMLEKYVGKGQGTSGWGNAYIEYGFKHILDDVPEYLERLNTKINEESFYPSAESLFLYEEKNKAAKILVDNHNFSRLIRPIEALSLFVADGHTEKVQELIEGWLTMSYLETFMNATRKVWAPGCHEGSQGEDHHGYRVLANTINAVLDRREKEMDEC